MLEQRPLKGPPSQPNYICICISLSDEQMQTKHTQARKNKMALQQTKLNGKSALVLTPDNLADWLADWMINGQKDNQLLAVEFIEY